MSNITARKARIREALSAQRRGLSSQTQAEASKKILSHLKAKFNWSDLSRVGLYRAMGGEVGTAEIEEWLRSQGKVLYFPRTQLQSQKWDIDMVEMGPRDRPVMSPQGTEEPPAEKPPTPAGQMDLVLLPGVAFDRSGRRLGRGKGCYDRWLKGFTGIRVGLAHSFQLLEEIPEAPFDEGVDFIVTPEEFCSVKGKV